jgi:serine/threonine-protein kinase SRPK3
VDGIATWSEEEVYMYLGKPELDPLELATGEPYTGTNGPRALVERADMATVFREHLTDDISISIIDFGQAFRSSEPDVPDVGTPESYCAPELLFNGKASESSDAWALGCCLFEIRGSVQLFSSFMGNSTGTVRMMVQKFGKLPEPWWSEWDESRRKYFNEDGEPRTDWDRGIVAIQNIGVGAKYGTDANGVSTVGETSCWIPYPASPRVERAEARDLEDLLLRVLKYKPEERASVEAVCRHTWFISDYEGS